jgi:ribosomal-protein-alanine N-acetyltransferase
VAHETTRRCAFSTSRLVVGNWHELSERFGLDLIEIVCGVLTRATTMTLPPDWHGDYDGERARRWVDARDGESPTLLVIERDTHEAIGLLIRFEIPDRGGAGRVDVRVGYVLAQWAWGRGFATELVRGFVAWARSEPSIGSISGGVPAGHHASARVLLNNGFAPSGPSDGEQIYQLNLDG